MNGGKGGGVFKPVSSQFLVWAKEKGGRVGALFTTYLTTVE